MTPNDHMGRVRKLAEQARQWEAQDGVCPIPKPVDDGPVCSCPTCGVATHLLRGALRSRGWDANGTSRVVVTPPSEAASYPYLAAIRVSGREVYRIHADLAEVMDSDVLADIEAALGRPQEKPSC